MKQIFTFVGIVIMVFIVISLSGCQIHDCPNPTENKPMPIGCILQYRERYLNKAVTIKGTYGVNNELNVTWVTTPSIIFGDVLDTLTLIFLEEVNKSMLTAWKDYYFTGIVKEQSNANSSKHELYLEVSKIEYS